jgi:hypothetical protein
LWPPKLAAMRQEYWDNFLRMAEQVGVDPDDLRE